MYNYRTAELRQGSATYPSVVIAGNPLVENRINRLIAKTTDETLPAGRYRTMNIITAASKYDTTVNRSEVLSLRFENYYYPERMASGLTLVQGLTVNLTTAKKYRLKDLFKANYQGYLNNIIKKQIEERDIQLVNEFPGINGNEVFYLREDSLVIVYQQYELTPGYYGTLEFNIPYSDLLPIINENGPISLILS